VVQADVLSGRLLSTRLCFLSALSVLFGGWTSRQLHHR
jgi:hypothetical protein